MSRDVSAEVLLRKLADGELHSGEALARELGVTRAAIWKRMDRLRAFGLEVESARRRGYRLSQPIDLIDPAALRARFQRTLGARLNRLEVFTELPSTNRHLLDGAAPASETIDVCLAEYQSSGRGRRGRTWQAPLASGLCLSVGASFAETPPGLAALTLAVGTAMREALVGLADIEIGLKWPNDLVVDDAKLGGILVELAAEAHGGCRVVVGVGVNVELPPALRRRVCAWPAGAADLRSVAPAGVPSRTDLAGALVERLATLLGDYPRTGFAPYRDAWRRADYLNGKAVRIDSALGPEHGTARGIDEDGALRLELEPGRERRIISGDVSVRDVA